jgi:Ca2+-binding RTX toxin-like protein
MPSNRSSNSGHRDGRDNQFKFDITKSEGVSRNLGSGDDSVEIKGDVPQIRITFTSIEIGNGDPNDSNTLANQDGDLAVRVQAEDALGNLAGAVSRFDDEGFTFRTKGAALFDVRDLVTGVSRGLFDQVILGTNGGDTIDVSEEGRHGRHRGDPERHGDDDPQAYYINGGAGDDIIFGGTLNDFIVGGSGNDTLTGNEGNDSFIGGFGDDIIVGGIGDDTATFNITADGSDRVDLGAGLDRVVFVAPVGSQIRITFRNVAIGNVSPTDLGTSPAEDGGLAVRIQLEDAAGNLIGDVSRFDDEGISFIRSPGQTFDVRELVSGAQRGDFFDVVRFGTSGDDTISDAGRAIRYYDDGGAGNDTLIGGTLVDALVGGLGDDRLDGREGNDALVGGAGADTFIFTGVTGNDRIIDYLPGTDRIDLSAFGITAANVSAAAVGPTTVLSVDTTLDGTADFTITLVTGVTPLATDYIF